MRNIILCKVQTLWQNTKEKNKISSGFYVVVQGGKAILRTTL
jgi:hypothetical protein